MFYEFWSHVLASSTQRAGFHRVQALERLVTLQTNASLLSEKASMGEKRWQRFEINDHLGQRLRVAERLSYHVQIATVSLDLGVWRLAYGCNAEAHTDHGL